MNTRFKYISMDVAFCVQMIYFLSTAISCQHQIAKILSNKERERERAKIDSHKKFGTSFFSFFSAQKLFAIQSVSGL